MVIPSKAISITFDKFHYLIFLYLAQQNTYFCHLRFLTYVEIHFYQLVLGFNEGICLWIDWETSSKNMTEAPPRLLAWMSWSFIISYLPSSSYEFESTRLFPILRIVNRSNRSNTVSLSCIMNQRTSKSWIRPRFRSQSLL